ncbi:MAG: hypothetical protein GF350_12720 [Chitinivibrionales bacterium]|nr:hypothetical protein [Chitinivibrionales bacterium]
MKNYYSTYDKLKNRHHTQCMFNNDNGRAGDKLKISFSDKGELNGTFDCQESFQGYDGLMHGGMIAAIIDSAMAKCLMGHGILGFTGRMNIRYLKPVQAGNRIGIKCRITESYKELYKIQAEITQDSACGAHVTANARFYRIN